MSLRPRHNYTDGITLSVSYAAEDELATVEKLNAHLNSTIKWGSVWQAKFASHTNALLYSLATRVETVSNTNILSITSDKQLTCKDHIAREVSGKLASLRRISWLLDARGGDAVQGSAFTRALTA